jgi:Tfp pilus assembly PilM family ATPase
MAAKQNEKKKASKTKISKPKPNQKQAQFRIEIGLSMVKILRVDAKGKIVSNGYAPIEGDPMWADNTWIGRFSQTIRNAARNAKIPKGTNFVCSVVAGGPNVIVQRFTWPEMNHKAMIENAQYEIASYLPGAPSNFIVSAEIQRRNPAQDGKMPTMDVFVAAMPKDMALAISTAITWAGFKVTSLDVNENVRARLINRCCMVDGGTPTSYGVLDLTSSLPNITLYLDGFFYSTQYFSTIQQAYQPAATIEEMETADAASKAAAKEEHNVEALLREISFVADFIKYQERSNIQAILVLGNPSKDFVERLASGLDIPVHPTDVWLRTGLAGTAKGDTGLYLDAYASGLPSVIIGSQHMLDVKMPPIIRNPKARLTAIATGLLISITLALSIALFIPYLFERGMRRDYEAMDEEDARVTALVNRSPTDEMIQSLNDDIDFIETRVDGVADFYAEYAQASVIVPTIFAAEDIVSIDTINASYDNISIQAWAIDYEHLADLLEHFREHPLFRYSGTTNVVTEHDTTDGVSGTTHFNALLLQEGRAGAIDE